MRILGCWVLKKCLEKKLYIYVKILIRKKKYNANNLSSTLKQN